MPKTLTPFYLKELNHFEENKNNGLLVNAWFHLERAHILGQRNPLTYNYVHWKMLQFGFKIKDRKEILGQIPRLLFGGVKSFIGTIPIGNPGGANVPPLKSFPIDEELQQILHNAIQK